MAVLQWRRTLSIGEKASAKRETSPVLWISETGFLTGLQDQEHVGGKLLSCGRPVQELICESRTKRVGTGSRAHGELVARGANVMRGYWNDVEETLSHFGRNVSHGDIGYQDSAGYFYILDRLKT